MKTESKQNADPAYKFEGGYPTHETSQRLYDELDYQRAVQAYIWATPLVNSAALAKALTGLGVTSYRSRVGMPSRRPRASCALGARW